MNRLLTISRIWLLLIAIVAAGAQFSACSDDPAAPPAPTGSSKIVVMHANTDNTNEVLFKRDTATLAQLAYGGTATVTIPNGNSTISVRALSGTELKSTGVSLDSSTSTYVFFSGTAAAPEAFAIKTPKVTPSAPNASVRVVHASNNAGDISIKLNDLTGLSFTQNKLSYKSSTSYVTLPVASTNSLIIVKGEGTAATQLLSIGTNGVFAAGKSYTVVIYGSADPNAATSVKLTSKIIED